MSNTYRVRWCKSGCVIRVVGRLEMMLGRRNGYYAYSDGAEAATFMHQLAQRGYVMI